MYTSRRGLKVFDREDSHLHLPQAVVATAFQNYDLERSDLNGNDIEKVWMRGALHVPQPCYLVEAPMDCEDVYYERRGNRKGFSRMIRNREPEMVTDLMVVLKKSGNHYIVLTAYAGVPSPKEPWDTSIETPEEYRSSLEFWETHAIIPH